MRAIIGFLFFSFCLVSAYTILKCTDEHTGFCDIHPHRQLNINPIQKRDRAKLCLLHSEQSEALDLLTEQFKRLTRHGKLDMAKFGVCHATWASKLTRIEDATAHISTTLDVPIAFFKKHFEKVRSASALRIHLLRSFMGRMGISYLDELMNIYTSIYKFYNLDGTVNVWLPHIEKKVASLFVDLEHLKSSIYTYHGLPLALREFYDMHEPDVRRSLEFVAKQLERERKEV